MLHPITNGATLSGIKIATGPTDFQPIEQFRMMRFKGEGWELYGDLVEVSGRPGSD